MVDDETLVSDKDAALFREAANNKNAHIVRSSWASESTRSRCVLDVTKYKPRRKRLEAVAANPEERPAVEPPAMPAKANLAVVNAGGVITCASGNGEKTWCTERIDASLREGGIWWSGEAGAALRPRCQAPVWLTTLPRRRRLLG